MNTNTITTTEPGPTRRWELAAERSYQAWRQGEAYITHIPNGDKLRALWRQGYTAAQAGRLLATLARCDADGDKLTAFNDYFATKGGRHA